MSRVEFVSVSEWNAATDRAIRGGDLQDDPRCLYGWGCALHRFGHGCDRRFGHPGKCMVIGHEMPCESKHRPKGWDTHGRIEASR